MAMYAIDEEGQPLPPWRFLLLPGGRVSRAPFNLTIVGYVVLFLVIGAVGSMFESGGSISNAVALPLGLVLIFGQYAVLAVGAKRLHDLGRTGWWQLLYLLPLINIVLGLALMAGPGKREDNEYGPYPLAEAGEKKKETEEDDGEQADAEAVAYPLPFLKVLFSFRGRLNRRAFWLKGALPAIVIGIVLQGLIGGIASFAFGVSAFHDLKATLKAGRGDAFRPQSQFMAAHGRTAGIVTADAQGTRFEVTLAAAKDTRTLAREVIVSGRRLMVTAAKRPGDAAGFDLTFDWENLPPRPDQAPPEPMARVFSGLSFLVGLLLLWPWFAIAVKRFHDRDQSGWWSLIGLVPLIGQVWLLVVLGFLKGSEGDNRFGPDPLAAEAGT